MNKDELMELAENPDFISGIYNYCDRWCERCPFTSRCMVYATERAESISDDPESHDINNAKFWQKLEAIFRETHEMILEWAEEMGVDLESAEAEAAIAERGQRREEAKEHPVSLSARHYAQMVQEWFKEEFAVEENVHDDITGKARIALIAIDRSLSAWRLMQNALPEKTESTVPMLIELEQLRRAIERIFPRARDFIRPGFDELGSEFVS